MLEQWWVLGSEDIPLSAPLCVGVTPGYSFGAANTAACSGASASNSLRPRSRSAANTTGRTHCGCLSQFRNKIARVAWGVLHGGRNFEVRSMKTAPQAG